MWQGIGVVVAILAFAFAVINWGVPAPLPKPTAAPTTTLTPTTTPTSTPPVIASAEIAIRAWHGDYVAVPDPTTSQRLRAVAKRPDGSSKFNMACLANNKVALQFSNRFVSALNDEPGRNWELGAEAVERLAWEEFWLFNPDNQDPLHCIEVLEQLEQSEVRLAFKTFHGKFVDHVRAGP